MTGTVTAHPTITSLGEWLARRLELLQEEKELTKRYDRIKAPRRRFPKVRF
jgi:predicted dithiol-disulfide oxidoreductase (DUF899 family)